MIPYKDDTPVIVPRKDFAAKIKDKYPQYKEVDDEELVDKIIEKYPSYASTVEPKKKDLTFPGQVDLSKDLPPGPETPSAGGEPVSSKPVVESAAPEQGIKFPTGDLGKPIDFSVPDTGKLSKLEERQLREKLGIDQPEISAGEATYSVVASLSKPFVELASKSAKGLGLAKSVMDKALGRVGRSTEGKQIQEYDAYQFGEWIDKKALEIGITATNPRVEKTVLGGQVPAALGTALSLIMTGGMSAEGMAGKELLNLTEGQAVKGALKEFGGAVTSRAGLAGGNMIGMSEFEQAKAAGASDDDAFGVYLKNVGVGATMAIPLARAFTRINEFTGSGLIQALKRGGTQSLEMGVQGGMAHYLTAKVAQGSYDPKREPFKGLLEAVGVQMFVGMVLPGIMGAYSKMTPEQVKETKQVIHDDLKEYESAQGPTREAAAAAEGAKVASQEIVSPQASQQAEPEPAKQEVVSEPVKVTELAPSKPVTKEIVTETSKLVEGKDFVLNMEFLFGKEQGDIILKKEDGYYLSSKQHGLIKIKNQARAEEAFNKTARIADEVKTKIDRIQNEEVVKEPVKEEPKAEPQKETLEGFQEDREKYKKLSAIVGESGISLLKTAKERLGEKAVNIDRIIDQSRKIQKADNRESEKIPLEIVAEALQYEEGHNTNWQDLRDVVEKGGFENNQNSIERQLHVGIKIPQDILDQALTPSQRQTLVGVKEFNDAFHKKTSAKRLGDLVEKLNKDDLKVLEKKGYITMAMKTPFLTPEKGKYNAEVLAGDKHSKPLPEFKQPERLQNEPKPKRVSKSETKVSGKNIPTEPGPLPVETERPSPDSGTEKPGVTEVSGEKPSDKGTVKPSGKGPQVGDKINFEWLDESKTGVITELVNGKFKVKTEEGTVYRVKPEDVKTETFSKIPKKTSNVVEDLNKILSLPKPAPSPTGKITPIIINPLKIVKALWMGANKAQHLLLTPLVNRVENWVARQSAAGLKHSNVILRNLAGTAQNLIGGLAYTEGSLKGKLEYMGNKSAGNVRAHAFHRDMYSIIGNDPLSLAAVHQALDPETWVSSTQVGQVMVDEASAFKKDVSVKQAALTKQINLDPTDIIKIDQLETDLADAHQKWQDKQTEIKAHATEIGKQAESRLNAKETVLKDFIRKTNDFIHDWHHDQGLITDEVYLKHQGKYIARLYEEFELTPPDIEQVYQSSRPDFNIFKARKDFESVEATLLRDPVYATSKRLGQMLQTQALFDYARDIAGNKDLKVSDTEFPNSTRMGDPKGKPYYGDLTGKYIPNFIAQDIKGFFFANRMMDQLYGALRGYDKLAARQFLKKLHTIYNPLVQLGNKTANYSFAAWAGVDPLTFTVNKFRAEKVIRDQYSGRILPKPETTLGKAVQGVQKVIRAPSELLSRLGDDRYLHEVMSKGLLGTDLLTSDLKPGGVAESQNRNILQKASDKASEYYGRADDEAKLAAYIALREDYGYGVDKAAGIVYQSFQNYATVGKLYDMGSKVPIFGNPYIKFKADLARIIKNGVVHRPLTMAAYLGSLVWMKNFLSQQAEESDFLKKIRERRSFIPKINTPFGDIAMTWQVPHVGEVNFARFISPYYLYDKGDHDDMLSDITAWAPLQFDYTAGISISKEIQVPMIEMNDVFLGTYVQTVWDRDFRGKSIQDPRGNEYLSVETSVDGRILNAMNYIARSQVPMYSSAADMWKAYNGEADYYGRERTITQALLNNIIKVQEFGNDQARESLTKEIKYKVSKFESYSRDISALAGESAKQMLKIDALSSSEERKGVLKAQIIEELKRRVLDKLEEQKKILKELEDPKKLLDQLNDAAPAIQK